MNKTEYGEKKVKLEHLKSQITDFEGGFSPYDEENLFYKWQKWNALTNIQKEVLAKDWEAYYETCRTSFYGKKMQECAKALKADNKTLVTSIVAEVKARPVKDTPKPSSIDPDELWRKMEGYRNAKNEITKLEEIVEMYAPIYEHKSKKEINL